MAPSRRRAACSLTGYVWRSPDAGKTWTRQALGSETESQPLLLAVAHDTSVATQGQNHDRSLSGWTSSDGVTWATVNLDLPGRSDKTRVSVAGLEGFGDGVDLLLRAYDNTDRRTVLHHAKIG